MMNKIKTRNFPFFLSVGVIILIMAGWLLPSCLTVGKIQRNCDKFATVCITDSKTSIVYRDTTVFITDTLVVELPRDTVKLTDTVTVINSRAYLPPVYKEFGLVWARAQIKNNLLDLQAGLTKAELLQVKHDTILIEKAIKEQTTEDTVVLPPERYVPKFYKVTFWIVVLATIVVIFYFRSKILSGAGIVCRFFSNSK